LLGELSSDSDVQPDIIVFYTLMRAFTDHADMKAAMRVYEQMTQHGLRPDEFVFNALINGCAIDEKVTVDDFNVLMDKLLSDGLKPTTTTLSIMLKALARCGSWDEALELLESAPARFNARVETRLYVQLAQAAIKANCRGHALKIHDAMVLTQGRRGQEGKAASRWLLKQCDVHPLYKAKDHHRATSKETIKLEDGN
jgi:pentatricopeptide repeat protein